MVVGKSKNRTPQWGVKTTYAEVMDLSILLSMAMYAQMGISTNHQIEHLAVNQNCIYAINNQQTFSTVITNNRVFICAYKNQLNPKERAIKEISLNYFNMLRRAVPGNEFQIIIRIKIASNRLNGGLL